jgi:hypothetical protein
LGGRASERGSSSPLWNSSGMAHRGAFEDEENVSTSRASPPGPLSIAYGHCGLFEGKGVSTPLSVISLHTGRRRRKGPVRGRRRPAPAARGATRARPRGSATVRPCAASPSTRAPAPPVWWAHVAFPMAFSVQFPSVQWVFLPSSTQMERSVIKSPGLVGRSATHTPSLWTLGSRVSPDGVLN